MKEHPGKWHLEQSSKDVFAIWLSVMVVPGASRSSAAGKTLETGGHELATGNTSSHSSAHRGNSKFSSNGFSHQKQEYEQSYLNLKPNEYFNRHGK